LNLEVSARYFGFPHKQPQEERQREADIGDVVLLGNKLFFILKRLVKLNSAYLFHRNGLVHQQMTPVFVPTLSLIGLSMSILQYLIVIF